MEGRDVGIPTKRFELWALNMGPYSFSGDSRDP